MSTGLPVDRLACLAVAMLLQAACVSHAPRQQTSSLGCMRAQLRTIPEGLGDAEKHCVASGLIARHCSSAEAWMAGAGKEFKDLFTRGDASWQDWRDDRRGMACARSAADDAAVLRCCETLPESVTP